MGNDIKLMMFHPRACLFTLSMPLVGVIIMCFYRTSQMYFSFAPHMYTSHHVRFNCS